MKISYKAAGIVASVVLITTPLLASAQTDTSLDSQVQSLMSQITSLESQLKSLLKPEVGSSTVQWNQGEGTSTQPWNTGNGSSTQPNRGDQGGGFGAPCPDISRDLSIGSSGSDVSSLQQMLSSLGFLNASSTGYFGQLTANALAQFQNQNGISTSSNGYFGSLTRNFFNTHCGQQGNGMGSSTQPHMPWPGNSASSSMPWQNGSSTRPWQGGGASTTPCGMVMPGSQSGSGYGSTFMGMRPCGGMASSTSGTEVSHPCGQQGATSSSALDQAAAVAEALFVPHTVIPGMDQPCHGSMMNQGGSNGQSMGPMIPANDNSNNGNY